MAWWLKRTVVLVGMMGAGKTAVGTALARQLGVRFIDSDDEIVKAANMSVTEIFERDGEAFFRRKEAQVIARLLAGRPSVLSTGGGAFQDPGTRQLVSKLGVSVWLKADLDLLWVRVRGKATRPLLQNPDPYGTLRRLLEERAPIYGQADLVVVARPEYSIDQMAERVLEALAGRPDVLEQKGERSHDR